MRTDSGSPLLPRSRSPRPPLQGWGARFLPGSAGRGAHGGARLGLRPPLTAPRRAPRAEGAGGGRPGAPLRLEPSPRAAGGSALPRLPVPAGRGESPGASAARGGPPGGGFWQLPGLSGPGPALPQRPALSSWGHAARAPSHPRPPEPPSISRGAGRAGGRGRPGPGTRSQGARGRRAGGLRRVHRCRGPWGGDPPWESRTGLGSPGPSALCR